MLLSASAVEIGSGDKFSINYAPVVNAASLYTSVSESQFDPRIPLTASWAETISVENRLNVTFAGFPTYSAGVTPSDANTLFYGAQSHVFCARDNTNFRFANLSMSSDGGTTEDLQKRVLQKSAGAGHAFHDPFGYITTILWPTSSQGGGLDWLMEDVNSLTSSVVLGS